MELTSRFVITGTGASGTHWCAAVIRSAGIKCGHQDIFRHEHTLGAPVDWKDYQGACSFEAVPLLPTINARKVLVVRDPLKVISSYIRKGLFWYDMREKYDLFSQVLDIYCPDVLKESWPVSRAARFWIDWNRIALKEADVVLDLEHLTPAGLLKACGVKGKAKSIPPQNVSNPKQINWNDIPVKLRTEIQTFALEL